MRPCHRITSGACPVDPASPLAPLQQSSARGKKCVCTKRSATGRIGPSTSLARHLVPDGAPSAEPTQPGADADGMLMVEGLEIIEDLRQSIAAAWRTIWCRVVSPCVPSPGIDCSIQSTEYHSRRLPSSRAHTRTSRPSAGCAVPCHKSRRYHAESNTQRCCIRESVSLAARVTLLLRQPDQGHPQEYSPAVLGRLVAIGRHPDALDARSDRKARAKMPTPCHRGH